MSNLSTSNQLQKWLESPAITKMLGENARTYTMSIIQCIANNSALETCDRQSILNGVITAASLGLPISNELGYCYLIPYNTSIKENGQWVKKKIAQFQISYRGWIQLAQRTGQYKTIHVLPIYESNNFTYNHLTQQVISGDFEREGTGKVVGVFAYFQLKNGFEKSVYWSTEKIMEHGKRFSQTFANEKAPWTTDRLGMMKKTVLKHLLNKYGSVTVDVSLSIELAKKSDQSTQLESGVFSYPDNEPRQVGENHQKEAFLAFARKNTSKLWDNINYYIEKAKQCDALVELQTIFVTFINAPENAHQLDIAYAKTADLLGLSTEFNARMDELELQNQENGKD